MNETIISHLLVIWTIHSLMNAIAVYEEMHNIFLSFFSTITAGHSLSLSMTFSTITWSGLRELVLCLHTVVPSCRCDMAFFEPMHHNKPNIIYLPAFMRLIVVQTTARWIWQNSGLVVISSKQIWYYVCLHLSLFNDIVAILVTRLFKGS